MLRNYRGVRGAVRLGHEAKSEPIQKIKYVRFGSVRLGHEAKSELIQKIKYVRFGSVQLVLKKNPNRSDPNYRGLIWIGFRLSKL